MINHFIYLYLNTLFSILFNMNIFKNQCFELLSELTQCHRHEVYSELPYQDIKLLLSRGVYVLIFTIFVLFMIKNVCISLGDSLFTCFHPL